MSLNKRIRLNDDEDDNDLISDDNLNNMKIHMGEEMWPDSDSDDDDIVLPSSILLPSIILTAPVALHTAEAATTINNITGAAANTINITGDMTIGAIGETTMEAITAVPTMTISSGNEFIIIIIINNNNNNNNNNNRTRTIYFN